MSWPAFAAADVVGRGVPEDDEEVYVDDDDEEVHVEEGAASCAFAAAGTTTLLPPPAETFRPRVAYCTHCITFSINS